MADPFSGGIMPQVIQNRQGLQGLEINQLAMQQQQQQMQQQQQQQQREAEAEQLLSKFQQGGGTDFSLINQAVLKSPTAAKNVLATIGIADKAQKQQAANDIAGLLPVINDPTTFNRVIAQRIATIKERGGNATDSINLAKVYKEQGPEAAKRELQIVGAALANEGFLKPEMIGLGGSAGQQPADVAEFEYYRKLQANNPKAAEAFGRSKGYISSAREENKTQLQRDFEQWQKLGADGDPTAQAFGRAAGFESKAETQANAAMRQQEAKQGAIDLNAITKESRAARSTLTTLDQMSKLEPKAFENFAGVKSFTSKLANQIGIDVEGLSESEAFEAVATGVVLDKAQQMAGALSNADMVFLQNSAPSLSQTSEGRKMLIDFGKKLAQRQIDYAQEAAKFRSKNGYFDLTQFETEFRTNKGDLFKSDNGQSTADAPATKQPEAIAIEGYTVEVVN
jgi:hypothetical protein